LIIYFVIDFGLFYINSTQKKKKKYYMSLIYHWLKYRPISRQSSITTCLLDGLTLRNYKKIAAKTTVFLEFFKNIPTIPSRKQLCMGDDFDKKWNLSQNINQCYFSDILRLFLYFFFHRIDMEWPKTNRSATKTYPILVLINLF
jgi:hypothetical protein